VLWQKKEIGRDLEIVTSLGNEGASDASDRPYCSSAIIRPRCSFARESLQDYCS